VADQIYHDHELIDLHWLTVSGGIGTGAHPITEAIHADGIEAEAAVKFACLRYKKNTKVGLLDISPLRQVGCILLCEDGPRNLRRAYLREWRSHAHRLQREGRVAGIDIEKVSATWLARELAPPNPAVKGRDPATVARVLEMILGEPVSSHFVTQQLEYVGRYIDER